VCPFLTQHRRDLISVLGSRGAHLTQRPYARYFDVLVIVINPSGDAKRTRLSCSIGMELIGQFLRNSTHRRLRISQKLLQHTCVHQRAINGIKTSSNDAEKAVVSVP